MGGDFRKKSRVCDDSDIIVLFQDEMTQCRLFKSKRTICQKDHFKNPYFVNFLGDLRWFYITEFWDLNLIVRGVSGELEGQMSQRLTSPII